jgi:hypothetical protein
VSSPPCTALQGMCTARMCLQRETFRCIHFGKSHSGIDYRICRPLPECHSRLTYTLAKIAPGRVNRGCSHPHSRDCNRLCIPPLHTLCMSCTPRCCCHHILSCTCQCCNCHREYIRLWSLQSSLKHRKNYSSKPRKLMFVMYCGYDDHKNTKNEPTFQFHIFERYKGTMQKTQQVFITKFWLALFRAHR